MPLKYGLRPNTLSTKGGNYIAVVGGNETYTTERIVEMMIQKGSTVTKAEALAVIEEYHSAVEQLVSEGAIVHTDLFTVSSGIAGNFDNITDSFDSQKHQVKLHFKAGERLIKARQRIRLKKKILNHRAPFLKQFTDLSTNATDASFTPGQPARIKGTLLKFDAQDPAQGIYLIAEDRSETKVEILILNKPSELMFIMPDELRKGNYKLEVRAIVHRAKTIRTGSLQRPLVAKEM
ncbi:DUF4469 domain-containing protein [Carboxylicivirga sediminis]|uniref:DUF4469 domain-containing protein n=1 Tax=Carboxylicivirga sediminis TaxID=2006564 RepID=A0A941F784_9BACT|nr:DNA-binding domain-containing protein [Carboxylicivirga sediminis]MBR8537737.1 DUF4469 domain-containing protein [Carboxylicivirga sediminis]